MRGELAGERVIISGSEAENVELKGYGRRESAKAERTGAVSLSLEEAVYLLESGKLTVTRAKEAGHPLTREELLQHALELIPNFGARYLTYKDLKERGYIVQTGGVDFWLFPRGSKPGEKPARYFIRILSERASLSVKDLEDLLSLAHNMRKEPIIAVVDDESDVTYYEVREVTFEAAEPCEVPQDGVGSDTQERAPAFVLGDRVVVRNTELADRLYKGQFYGSLTKENTLLLSLVEAAYLATKGVLELDFQQFIEYATAVESDFRAKYTVYRDLREKGLILKTGFKFGSHFRVYRSMNKKHSTDLIQVLPGSYIFSMPELARAVRLAHGVKKRMIFVYQDIEQRANRTGPHALQSSPGTAPQRIRYVDIGRMKL